ncbi:potassium channel family protein [Candidatus Woesearchaeota archaeon]|nr:potassium channel family protein [Candidatus Woesearchaeota archaeon]
MAQRSLQTRAYGAVAAIVLLVLMGTFVYHFLEGWNYLDSAYFTVVTLTTIGYGDLAPTHDVSKLFTIFFVVSGVGVFLFALTLIAEHYLAERVGMMEKTLRRVQIQAAKAMERWTPEKDKEPPSRRSIVKGMEIFHRKPKSKQAKFES